MSVFRATRLQINPQPLRIVQRRELATDREIAMKFRCRATTAEGTQCTRVQANDSDRYCWQHKVKP